MPATDAFAGTVLSHYRLEEQLGAGGMGMLYRATDLKLGRAVAIKLLARHLVSDETAKARFIREARAASALDHPNIATVYEIGEEDSELFIAMALYEGETVKQRLEKGKLAVEGALDVLRQVSLGLEAAHRAGIVHRDIKPANIVMTRTGTVKILDFGLAKLVSDSQAQMTQAGQAMGTVLYMSPEQLRGEPVDQRSDLWSLGVLAYEVLAGISPFQTDSSAATAMRILNDEPPSLAAVPGIPDWLAQLVSQLLRKNPAERPQTASEVLNQLEHGKDVRPPPAGASKVETVGNWFSELRRRRVFRALVGYGIAAFAVLLIIEPIMHGLHWPETVLSYVVAALAAGFPVVITLAWVFDMKAGQIERAKPWPSASGLRGLRLVLVLGGLGVLAATPGTVWYFLVRGMARPTTSPVATTEKPTPSIAVLPFVNLSSEKEQEYFSDGVAEEILNALAQVEGLQVAGRTSSFYFKGKNEDLASIAAKLHVATLLEGSVRKSGDRVRITAQLINAADGYGLWSKQYDRDLTDIFKVQAELATAVVEALKVKLLPSTRLSSYVRPAQDPEAYRLFLLGRSLDRLSTKESLRRSVVALEKAVALEPSYAPAWAELSAARGNIALDAPRAEVQPRARDALDAAERAIALDPDYAGGYAIRGWIRSHLLWDWAGGQSDVERALTLASRTEGTLNTYAIVLQKLGRLQEAIATQRKVVGIDALNPIAWTSLGSFLMQDGQLGAAREAFGRSQEISPEMAQPPKWLAEIDLLEGHAANALASIEKLPGEIDRLMLVSIAQDEMGHAPESQQALDALASKEEGPESNVAYRVAAVHAWRGERDSAFEWLERAYVRHDLELRFVKVDPFLRNLRADPRYAALLKKMNLPQD